MTRFADVLQRVEVRLTVPQPARSRIIHEMAADLEDLYAAYRARGIDEEEALRRAEMTLGASPEAVEALIQLHRPAWERLLTRYSVGRRNRVERVLITTLALAGLGLAGAGLARQGILDRPAPFVWPVLALSAAALVIAASVFFRLFIKQDHTPSTLHSGLVPLLALAMAILLAAAFGAAWEISGIAATVAAAGSTAPTLVMPHVRRAAEVLSLGLTGDLAVLLAWFHLRQRAQAIARAEAGLAVIPGRSPLPRRNDDG